jgi:hypothetical protein
LFHHNREKNLEFGWQIQLQEGRLAASKEVLGLSGPMLVHAGKVVDAECRLGPGGPWSLFVNFPDFKQITFNLKPYINYNYKKIN